MHPALLDVITLLDSCGTCAPGCRDVVNCRSPHSGIAGATSCQTCSDFTSTHTSTNVAYMQIYIKILVNEPENPHKYLKLSVFCPYSPPDVNNGVSTTHPDGELAPRILSNRLHYTITPKTADNHR